jgi:hypothetical protein
MEAFGAFDGSSNLPRATIIINTSTLATVHIYNQVIAVHCSKQFFSENK